jgi:hypothetical protein
MGDEGKAVGCVPPTALLSLRALVGLGAFLTSIKNAIAILLLDYEPRFCDKGVVRESNLGHQKFGGFQSTSPSSRSCAAAILGDGVCDHYPAATPETH